MPFGAGIVRVDYSPTLGRFLTRDPIGIAGGDVNWYCYCGNDPVNFVDPEGLMSWSEWCKKFEEALSWWNQFALGFVDAFADGSCLMGIDAWNAGLIYGPFGEDFYDSDYTISYWGGMITKGAFLGAVFGPGGLNLTGSTQMTTRWSAAGTIGSGDWVMLGPPSFLNLAKTTKWQLWWGALNGTVKSATMEVPRSYLAHPTESGIIGGAMRFVQGLFGQRVLW